MIPSSYRSHPHYTVGIYMAYAPMGHRSLSIAVVDGGIQNPIVYSGSVSGVDESKTWITVTPSSGLEQVQPGMTMWVLDGARRHKVRVRWADPANSRIRVAENDGIAWQGRPVMVLRHYELWAVHPRLQEDGTIFVDYDIAYADQNQREPPKANIGHMAFDPFGLRRPPVRILPDGQPAQAIVSFLGNHSFPVSPGSSIVSYQWFLNGQPAGSGAHADISIQGIGCHWVTLEVTDNHGKKGVVHQPFWLLRPPGARPTPSRPIALSGFRIRWNPESGWEAEIEAPDLGEELEPDSRVVIWADMVYGSGEPQPVLLLDGYLLEHAREFDAESERWRARAVSPDVVMRNLLAFPTILIAADSPGRWVEISKPATMARAVYHILKWRSTACEVLNFAPFPHFMEREFPKVEDQSAIAFQADSLGGQIDETVNTRGILARWGCGRDGTLRFWQDPRQVPDGARPALILLSPEDYIEEAEVRSRGIQEVGWVRVGGVSPSGPHLAWAPGNSPGQAARVVNYDSLWVTGQEELNQLAGLLYAMENAPEEISLRMAGAYLLDPAGMVRVRVPLPRWNRQGHWARRIWEHVDGAVIGFSMSWEREGHLQAEWQVGPEMPWAPGETRPVPPPPSWDWQDWTPPPIGEEPPPAGTAWWWVYVFQRGHSGTALVRCRNLRAAIPQWEVIASPDRGVSGEPFDFAQDPHNPAWGAMLTRDGLYVCSDLRAPTPGWQRVFSIAQVASQLGVTFSDIYGGYIQPLSARMGHFAVVLNVRIHEAQTGAPVFVWTTNRFASWSVSFRLPAGALDPREAFAPTERFDSAGFYFLWARPWYVSYNPDYNLYFVPWGGTPQHVRWLNLGWEISPVGLVTHPREPTILAILHTRTFVHQASNTVDVYFYSGGALSSSMSINPYGHTRLFGIRDSHTYRYGNVDPTREGIYHFMADAGIDAQTTRRLGVVVRRGDRSVRFFDPSGPTNYAEVAVVQFALWLGEAGEGIVYVLSGNPTALYAVRVDRELLTPLYTYAAPGMPVAQGPAVSGGPIWRVHPDWAAGG